MNTLAKISGLMSSDSSNTASAVVERDASGNSYFGKVYTSSAVVNSGGFSVGVASKTGNYAATAADCVLIVNALAATAITLPACGDLPTGHVYFIKRVNNDATFNITVTPTGDNIDGAATKVLDNKYDSIMIVSDGSDWHTIAMVGTLA